MVLIKSRRLKPGLNQFLLGNANSSAGFLVLMTITEQSGSEKLSSPSKCFKPQLNKLIQFFLKPLSFLTYPTHPELT